MNNIPRFNAEASLCKAHEQYKGIANKTAFINGEAVTPQLLPRRCGPCINGWKICCGIDCYRVKCICH